MTNRDTFLAVIAFLGLALLTCVGGVIALTATGHNIPDLLSTVAGGCLGGLAGMLTHPPTSDEPQPVEVQQPEGSPVPVAEAPPKRQRRQAGHFTPELGLLWLLALIVALIVLDHLHIRLG